MKTIPVMYMAVKAIFKQNINRAILSIIGVVIGVAAVITVVSIGRSFEKYTIENLTGKNEDGIRIVVNFFPENEELYHNNFSFFDERDVNLLTSIDGIHKVRMKENDNEVLNVDYDLEQKLQGTTDVSKQTKTIETEYIGRTVTDTDEMYHSKVAMIPSDLLNADLGHSSIFLNKTIKLNEQTFTIIGIYEAQDQLTGSNPIFVPENTFNQYFGQNNKFQYVEFYVNEPNRINAIIHEIQQKLASEGINRHLGTYDITNTSAVSKNISQLFSVITMVVASIAGISLFIAGVGIMNMMYTSVSERRREIGVKRALGATKKQIMHQFLLEGILISLLGGCIGLLFGWLLSQFLSIFFPFHVQIDSFTVLLAIGISSIVGIVFSFVPAKKAAAQNTIAILQ
ncbi:ABC transporter permease [Neobacillus sp. Marseille-QA0830]